MISPPEVTVVVPVHDVVDYLDDCVTSIVSQTEPRLEIILVDDGSSDGSENLCDAWAEQDPRIRVIHQAPQGSSVARNTGIDEAQGRYLTFVDADDVIAPHLVAGLLQPAEETGAEITIGELTKFTDPNSPEFTTGTTTTVSPAQEELATVMRVRPQWGPVAKLIRRELFDGGPRFPEGLVHQDLAFTPQIFQRANRCARTDAVIYGYRQRAGSVSDNVRRVALSPDLITILRSNIEFARETQPRAEFEHYLVSYLRHARKQIERLDTAESRRRNASFVRAYRSLARDYLRELAAVRSVPVAHRAAWTVAALAPDVYAVGFATARRVASRVRRSAGTRLD